MSDLSSVVAVLLTNIAFAFANIFDEGKRREAFTQEIVAQLSHRYPVSNVMVVASPYTHSFTGEQKTTAKFTRSIFETDVNFDVYVFTAGTFILRGDGGLGNWCFGGKFVREGQDGKEVVFSAIDAKNPSPRPPLKLPPVALPSNPTPAKGDGLCLVNSEKNGKWTSGIAWYRSIRTRKDGQQPDAYVDIKTDGTVTWEGKWNFGVFPDGNKVWAGTAADSQSKNRQNYSKVGNAGNLYHGFTVYKDNIRVIYEVGGWKVYSVYFCA